MFIFPGNDWNGDQHGAGEHSCVEDSIWFLHLGDGDPGIVTLCKLIVIFMISDFYKKLYINKTLKI